VRRDPFAMLPFCGYNIAEYFKHWIKVGRASERAPRIFHVNWFRRDKDNKFLWPGYGENLRVLEWILQRARGEGEAVKTPIGYVPTPDSLDMTGLDLEPGVMDELLHVSVDDWRDEANDIEAFFDSLGSRMPWELRNELEGLRHRLNEADPQ
jgi:phosphoenolpyruvate carboxykinase (GTP)